MKPKALIVYGGWDGHHPKEIAELFRRILSEDGFDVQTSDTLDAYNDPAKLQALSLIIPHWTMGKISSDQANNVRAAVASGVGLAGCHGGLCDAFRENTDWQFMTGGQWVAHPGNQLTYTVDVKPIDHPITRGIGSFSVTTEQYYMHVDPAVQALATTRFPTADGPHAPNGPVAMPVIWTKLYGQGRIYYNSLGHDPAVVEQEPVLTLMRRGFHWAARQAPQC